MSVISRVVLVSAVLLLAMRMTAAYAQSSLAQMRQDLISPWLMQVQGEDRARLLRINEVAQETEGSYLLSASLGWADGAQSIVRIELILSGLARRLVIRTGAGNLISVQQSPNGDFTGTYKPNRGAEKAVKLEKVTEEQLPRLVKESQAGMAARVFANEDKDWGVPPTKRLRNERMHAPTPREIPGAVTIRTMELKALQSRSPAPVLVDALKGSGHRTISGAHWLSSAGEGVGNAARERLRADLEKLTTGNKAAPVVFFCSSSECWLSYNASLHAVELGYMNVYWFRGGTAAWQRAGFEMVEATPYRR